VSINLYNDILYRFREAYDVTALH